MYHIGIAFWQQAYTHVSCFGDECMMDKHVTGHITVRCHGNNAHCNYEKAHVLVCIGEVDVN